MVKPHNTARIFWAAADSQDVGSQPPSCHEAVFGANTDAKHRKAPRRYAWFRAGCNTAARAACSFAHPCEQTRSRRRPNKRVMAVYPSGCACRIAVRFRTKSHRMVWNLALVNRLWRPSHLIFASGSETCPKHPGSGVDDGASGRLSESNNAYSISGKLASWLGSSNPSKPNGCSSVALGEAHRSNGFWRARARHHPSGLRRVKICARRAISAASAAAALPECGLALQ